MDLPGAAAPGFQNCMGGMVRCSVIPRGSLSSLSAAARRLFAGGVIRGGWCSLTLTTWNCFEPKRRCLGEPLLIPLAYHVIYSTGDPAICVPVPSSAVDLSVTPTLSVQI